MQGGLIPNRLKYMGNRDRKSRLFEANWLSDERFIRMMDRYNPIISLDSSEPTVYLERVRMKYPV